MTLQTTTIRPGYILTLRTGIGGNVKYSKTIIEPDTEAADGSQKGKWETERVIQNAAELKEATVIRSKVRSNVAGLCAQTSFGLLCPKDKYEELGARVIEARALVDDFNSRATTTTISMVAVAGELKDNDLEAVRAINGEVRSLLSTMESGLQNLDAKAVRDAADRARSLGAMLSPEMGDRVKEAIDTARKAARDMVKAAEQGSAEIDLLSIRKITEARTSFLDMGDVTEVASPTHEARALDLAPIDTDDQSIAPASPAATVPQFEMD